MTAWIAVAYGALDVPRTAAADTDTNAGDELIVYPVFPSEPRIMVGSGRALWQKLATAGPVDDSDLSDDEYRIVREMEVAGVTSRRQDHHARVRQIPHPWFESPLHEMVCALVACVARDNGIEAVFIKGPVLHAQGLRARAHSGDVDIWVDPARLDDMLTAIEPWGWKRQPDLWADTEVNHSRTLLPTTDWACEIDVHRRLPGIGVTDTDAFQALVHDSETAEFAGVTAAVPNREMSAALSALHAMRPEVGIGTRPGAKSQAVSVLQLVGVDALAPIARLGAQSALQDALLTAFPETYVPSKATPPARDWDWRKQPNRARGYVIAWRTVPPRNRLRLVWHIVWPSEDLVRLSDSNAGAQSSSVFVARARRLLRGVTRPR